MHISISVYKLSLTIINNEFNFRYYTFTGRALRAQSMTTSTTNQTRPTHTASERSTTTESISLANHGINNPS